MTQITIDVERGITICFALLGAAVFLIMIIFMLGNMFYHQDKVENVVVSTPLAPTFPSTLDFVVLSTSTSNGKYSVMTTAGNIIYMQDYYTWDRIQPQNEYRVNIVGEDQGAYIAGKNFQLIRSVYSNRLTYGYDSSVYGKYPTYYHYKGTYYSYDGITLDPMMYKQVVNERIIEGLPYNYRGRY